MSVSQVWGYVCDDCRENDYAYDTEAEALRALAAHAEQSGCEAGDD